MALNIPNTGGTGHRIAVVKYDARAGRIFRMDRSDASGSWVTTNTEITNVFQAIIDLENIETGWLNFPTGAAPDIRTVKVGESLPDRPTPKHRGGYRVLMKLGKHAGGDLREMAANAKVSTDAMDLLHDAYMKDRDAHPGELPVIGLKGTITRVAQGKADGQPVSSTNYEPIWEILKWIPRPPELQPGYEPPEVDAHQAAAPAQAAPAAAAPVEIKRELASVDDDF